MPRVSVLAAMPSIARNWRTSMNQGSPLQTVPTLASAIVPDMFPPDLGWDYNQVLHVEQEVVFVSPDATCGRFATQQTGSGRV